MRNELIIEQKMGIPFTGFKAIAIFLTSMVVQSFSELVVVRHPPTNNGLERKLTCVSEEDGSALIWNDELGRTEQFNPKKFKPERPASTDETQCAVWNSTQCIAKWGDTRYWEVVNSFTDPMGPVFDYRWEGFDEYTFENSIDNERYQHVVEMSKHSYTVVYSARGLEDVDILLCRKKDPTKGPCLWITIGAEKNDEWKVQYCDKGPPAAGRSRASSTCDLVASEQNQYDIVIRGDKWQTFTLHWNHTKPSIKLSKELGEGAILHTSSLEPEILSHVSVRSGLGTRVRFHSYKYFLTKTSGVSITTEELKYTGSEFCVELLVGLCYGCKLLVYMVDVTFITPTLIQIISGNATSRTDGLLTWTSVEIRPRLNDFYPQDLKLRIETQGSGQYAIGNFRTCKSSGNHRASTITVQKKLQGSVSPNESLWPKIGCQELSYTKDKNVVVDSLGRIPEAARTAKQLRDFTQHLSESCGSQCEYFDEKSSICKQNGCTCGKGYDGVYCDEATECFRVTKITKTSITLDWNRERKNCKRYDRYVVSHRKLSEDGVIFESADEFPVTVANLDSDTAYEVKIEEQANVVLYTEELSTLEAGPGQVQGLFVRKVYETEVTLAWKPPSQPHKKISKYIVTLKRVSLRGCDDRAEATPHELPRKVETEAPTVYFENLHPYAKYRATVTAYTFEAGNKTSIVFDTTESYYDTSVVSDLNFDEKLQRLTWNRPENCATITGPIWGTSLKFTDLSNPASNENMIEYTTKNEFDLRSLPSIPLTTYEVCVKVMRYQYQRANSAPCTKTQLTTAPSAPPAVTDLTIYDADPGTNRISLRWKPPHPPHGKIESYHVSIEREKDPPKYVTIEASERKCEMWEDDVCSEDFELGRETSIRTKVQVYAKNENVEEGGNLEYLVFTPEDCYNKKPGAPLNLNATHRSEGVVTLKWNPPLFTATKITQFRIWIEALDKQLLVEEYSNFPMTVNYTAEKNQKEYNKEVSLPPSTTYRISAVAVNGRGNVSEKIPDVSVSVPAAVGFSSMKEPEVKDNGSLIEIKIPEVVNATKNTTIKVIVNGVSTCTPRISSTHLNQTTMVDKWEVLALEVKEKRSDDPLIINTKQHQGVDSTCSLHREGTYRILFVVKDRLTGASSTFTSARINLINRDQGMQTWLLPFIGIFAIIAICSILVFVWYRKRRRFPKNFREPSYLEVLPARPATPMTSNDLTSPKNAISSTAHLVPSETQSSAHHYWLPNEPDSRAVSMKHFEEYAKDAAASDLLYSQFMLLPRGLTKPCEYGSLPENIPKNRYRNQFAYDDTRVVLEKLPGDQFSDYINASYIKGFRKEKAYIATQGPKPNTINDFWRMIWQEDVRVICMMSNLVEGNTRMSEKYWPDLGSRMKFGNFLVSTTNNRVFADFTFRTFRLSCERDTREVTHLQFTGWPSLGVPSPQSFVAYLKKLIQTPAGNGPVVVHCHAGDGRTGVLILSDICLHQAIGENTIDVTAVTTRMRDSRTNMVATPQQFLFAHVIIVESLVSIPTQIPCTGNLPSRIQKMRLQLKADLQRLRDTMWQEQALDSFATKDHADADYITIEEIARASETSVVPDSERSQTFEGIRSSLNVVSVDGLRLKNQYLASWLPPPLTLSNFWEFVVEKNIQLIIILQCSDPKNPTCCDIIPDQLILPSMPHLMVESKTVPERDEYFATEKLRLTNSSERVTRSQTVTVLTCGGWEAGRFGKPPSPVALVSLWRASEKISRREGETLVLCHDGNSGCSLYLAMSFLLERMAVEGECDVISAVRTVRKSNPEFVHSKEQCEYLYDAAEIYAKYFECYANFK